MNTPSVKSRESACGMREARGAANSPAGSENRGAIASNAAGTAEKIAPISGEAETFASACAVRERQSAARSFGEAALDAAFSAGRAQQTPQPLKKIAAVSARAVKARKNLRLHRETSRNAASPAASGNTAGTGRRAEIRPSARAHGTNTRAVQKAASAGCARQQARKTSAPGSGRRKRKRRFFIAQTSKNAF